MSRSGLSGEDTVCVPAQTALRTMIFVPEPKDIAAEVARAAAHVRELGYTPLAPIIAKILIRVQASPSSRYLEVDIPIRQ